MIEEKEVREYIWSLVSGVTKIANALNKSRGYITTHNEADVSIILEAYFLLKAEGEKEKCES